MASTIMGTKGLAIAGLLMISSAASAQDNTIGNLDAGNVVNTNGMVTDPAMSDPLATNAADPLATPTTDPMMADNTTTMPVQEEDDDDFPWGLLGLLGLAGLIPRKRKGGDINVDARRDR